MFKSNSNYFVIYHIQKTILIAVSLQPFICCTRICLWNNLLNSSSLPFNNIILLCVKAHLHTHKGEQEDNEKSEELLQGPSAATHPAKACLHIQRTGVLETGSQWRGRPGWGTISASPWGRSSGQSLMPVAQHPEQVQGCKPKAITGKDSRGHHNNSEVFMVESSTQEHSWNCLLYYQRCNHKSYIRNSQNEVVVWYQLSNGLPCQNLANRVGTFSPPKP